VDVEQIKNALSQVKYPGFSRDIVSFGILKNIEVDGSDVTVTLSVQTKDPKIPEQIFKDSHSLLGALPGIGEVKIELDVQNPQAQGPSSDDGKSSIPGVKKIIAVASGKGGVGKSTVSSNLAISLAKQGLRVGLCDCDLYGPSIAHMFDVADYRPDANEQDQIIPVEAHGIQLMSMGFLLTDSSPVIVRGPLATRYTQQFLRQVAWDNLDVLILDLPPGTGDIQLTIVQTVALTGTVIVTTPQEVALIDARKAVSMFAKVNVPILGLIENMSWFECDLGTRYPIFGDGGGVREAEQMKVPLLGQIPIDSETRKRADKGKPVALISSKKNPISKAFEDAASVLKSSHLESS